MLQALFLQILAMLIERVCVYVKGGTSCKKESGICLSSSSVIAVRVRGGQGKQAPMLSTCRGYSNVSRCGQV